MSRSIRIWLWVREYVDKYFRNLALRDLGVKATPSGSLYRDLSDVYWSEEAHEARSAAYFVIDPKYRPHAHPEEISIMRASLEHGSNKLYHAHIEKQPNARLVAVLAPGVAEALGWGEGDRVAFKQLYSGELLTRLDKRARQ